MISLPEFREGCQVLNKSLHPDYQLTNIDHTLEMMDFDGSGTIDINEFFEVRGRDCILSFVLFPFVIFGCLFYLWCRSVLM